LPGDVQPGQGVAVNADVAVPDTGGKYILQWDMVQESITWFNDKGSSIAQTSLVVSAAGQSQPAPNDFVIRPAPQSRDSRTGQETFSRLTLWPIALRMASAYPLLGVGPDNFRWLYGKYLGLDVWNTDLHANNLYLEWLADTGIIGLIAFLWLSVTILRVTWQGVKCEDDNSLWVWQLAVLASLTAWYVHGLVDYFYEFAATSIAFWLLVGLAARRAVLAYTKSI